jgi:hypothetical protein
MLDPDEQNFRTKFIAQKVLQASKKAVRSHWDAYGKLNDPKTHLISLMVAAIFLVVAYLIVG